MSGEYKQLVAKRSPVRSSITNLLAKVQRVVSDVHDKDVSNLSLEICNYQRKIQRLRVQIQDLDKQILNLMDPIGDAEGYLTEFEAADDYQSKLDHAENLLQGVCKGEQLTGDRDSKADCLSEVLQKVLESQMNNAFATGGDASNVAPVIQQLVKLQEKSMNAQQSASLPVLEVREFNGDITKFIEFYDDFKATIHNQRSLQNVQKFKHLKRLLTGDVAKLIDSLPVKDSSYFPAMQRLINRYGSVETIVIGIFKKMLEVKKVYRPNLALLKQLSDKVGNYVLTLESMTLDSKLYSFLLYPILFGCLPDQMQLQFLRDKQPLKEEMSDLPDSRILSGAAFI